MEVVLAAVRPRQDVRGQSFRVKHYDILLFDVKQPPSMEKRKLTKSLPKININLEEEPRESVLSHLFHVTGGDGIGIKGERALFIPPSRNELSNDLRESWSRYSLYFVAVNQKDRLNKSFKEKSSKNPGFYALDNLAESLNNGTIHFPSASRYLLKRLESWLEEKHKSPGSVDCLFRSRAEFRIHISKNNPAFIPNQINSQGDGTGTKPSDVPQSVQLTANEALAKMLSIEKCDIVVMNPLFGSGLPYKTRPNKVVTNGYWGLGKPDYDKIQVPSALSFWPDDPLWSYLSTENYYPLHKFSGDGNITKMRELLNHGSSCTDKDNAKWCPIHYAAWNGHSEAVSLLLAAGCSPNITTNGPSPLKNGSTALHLAAINGYHHIVDLLLHHIDIDLNGRDHNGKTALELCEPNPNPDWQSATRLLRAAMMRPSNQIPVYVMDGSKRMLNLIDGENTTVRKLNTQMLLELKLPESYSDIFTMWICSPSLELQLKLEHKPVQQIHEWKKIVKMLTEGDPNTEEPQLKWRRNARISLKEEQSVVSHPVAIDLLYREAYYNYIKVLYPCKPEDVLALASILMYIKLGDYNAAEAKSFLSRSQNLEGLIPAPKLHSRHANWASKILTQYKQYSDYLSRNGYSSLTSKKHFLEVCQQLLVYGSAFFTGNVQESRSGRTMCHIGVNDVGIHIFNTETSTMIQSKKYSEIDWAHISQYSALELSVAGSPQAVISIKTKQAGLVYHLMAKLAQMHAGLGNIR